MNKYAFVHQSKIECVNCDEPNGHYLVLDKDTDSTGQSRQRSWFSQNDWSMLDEECRILHRFMLI